MAENNLRDKLRARRKEMNASFSTGNEAPTETLPEDNRTKVTMISEQPSSSMNQDEHDPNTLTEALQQRRERSRRILEKQETDQILSQSSIHAIKNQAALEESTGADHPFSDAESTQKSFASTEAGRSGKNTLERTSSGRAQLRSQLQSRLSKRAKEEGAFGVERSQRLKDRVARTTRRMMSSRQEEDNELLNQIQEKLKWKSERDKARTLRGEPTDTECYDFFTKQYEDLPSDEEAVEASPMATSPFPAKEKPSDVVPSIEVNEQASSKKVDDETLIKPKQSDPEVVESGARLSGAGSSAAELLSEEQPGNEVTEEQKKLISDVIAKDLNWELFQYYAAEYRGYNHQIATENLAYFVPNAITPDLRSKVAENTIPRYLEDEGIFVGIKPVVRPTNINILENRLLREPNLDRTWFGVDGRVEMEPDPVKQIPTKSWLDDQVGLDENLQTVYTKAYPAGNEQQYLQGSEENELQLDIGTVSFLHHPLMSKEHVLASTVTQLYDQYVDLKHKNVVQFFVDKLAALRNAVSDLKGHQFFYATPEDESAQEVHIIDYMSEIRRTTRQLNAAESSSRELMRKIIDEWKEIKFLREKQGYTNTSIKLTIKKQEVNREEDRQKWDKEVEMELSERRMEYQITVMQPFEESVVKYKSLLQEWKKKRAQIRENRKRKAGSGENLLDPASASQTENAEEVDEEMNIGGNVDKPEPPDKPPKFDEEATKVDIINTLLSCRRNPGEDKLSLQLTNTGTITLTSEVPMEEVQRRKATQKSSIIIKVYFNGRGVFTTDPRTLSSDFKLHFGIIFRIRISQWPESIKVQFFDAGLLVNTVFSEVFLRVPDTTVHSGNVQLGVVAFSSDQTVSYDHAGVGSNTPFILRQNDVTQSSYNTQGHLICSLSWSLTDEGVVLAPKGVAAKDAFSNLKKVDPISALGAEAVQDSKSVSKWVQDNRIDPNDPGNASLIPFMHDTDGHSLPHTLDFFRLEQLQEEFNFITDDEFNEMNRLRLLRLRFEEIREFRNLTMIPCQEHEVMGSTFTSYEKRLKERASVMSAEAEKFVDSGKLSAHRLQVMRYREQVKEQVLNRFFSARHYRTYEDVIQEEKVPDIKALAVTLAELSRAERPLKPSKKPRKQATSQMLTEGSVTINATVVRGHNVPIREESHSSGSTNVATTLNQSARFGGSFPQQTSSPLDIATKTYSVAPFVAISFQDTVVTTKVSQGPSPSWNEELQLPFSAPNSDYSATNLQTVDDIIYIHLFDRVIEEAPRLGDTDTTTVVHKITNHWLGSFRLPFSTLYQRGNIDGTFKLKVPPVLLGYTLEKSPSTDFRDEFDSQFSRLITGTFLTLFITLDPMIRPMDPIKDRFESKEEEEILSDCASFLIECHKKYPSRHVLATVINLKGESVLITRYVQAIQPPEEVAAESEFGSLNLAERLARFVSFIPSVSDNVTYAGVCDLWSTCDQFLNMLRGDEEEHAVLLLNFFLHLGKQAYLLLGHAVPEGKTAYVLTIEDTTKDVLIWNASSGQYYSSNDNLCPLRSVGTLVNASNVWFNIQPHDFPWKVRYDLGRKGDWKPLFNRSRPDLPSIQLASLYYVKTDEGFVAKLTQTIHDRLKDKFMSWRPRNVTRWNRACNGVLMSVLRDLEARNMRRGQQADVDHAAEIKNKLSDVKFTGFPMDLPFTDIDDVISAVKSTEVHKIQDENIEFSLAVYIYPYPSSILVVWVYIAALINKRRGEL